MSWLDTILRRNKETPVDERVEPVVGSSAVQNSAADWGGPVVWGDMFNLNTGPAVTEQSAMRVSAVYACVRLIAGAIADVPKHIYKKEQNGDRERINHDYWWLLNEQPCPGWSSAAFWEFIVAQMLLRGDGLAWLKRDNQGRVVAINPVARSQVVIEKVKKSNPRDLDRLVYYVNTDSGQFGVSQDDMLHFPGFGFNGVHGMSVIQWGAKSSIGIAISADEYVRSSFDSGGQPQQVVKAQGKMGESQQQAFLEAWRQKYSGPRVSGVPLILTEGLDITELSMTAKDAQLLESRQWQVVDIARAFGVPNHMINESTGSTSWGSGIEQLGIGFRVYTTAPHERRMMQELNRKLFLRAGTAVEFDSRGLMQSDHTARANYYKAGLGGTQNPAWLTPNEVRKLENLPALDDGDTLSKPQEKPNEEAAATVAE